MPRAGNNKKRQHILCRARDMLSFSILSPLSKKFMNQIKKNVRIPWLLVTAVFFASLGADTKVAKNILPERLTAPSAACRRQLLPRKVGGRMAGLRPAAPLVAMLCIATAQVEKTWKVVYIIIENSTRLMVTSYSQLLSDFCCEYILASFSV